MNNKSELLNQLKIDRDAAPEKQGLGWIAISLIALGCAIGGYYLAKLQAPEPRVAQDNAPASRQQSNQTDTPTKSKETETRTSKTNQNQSILNGSGYITARRMATVSSQVTGLITAVNVEEGMQVAKGDVLATLDDALAKTNLDYAMAQLETLKAREQSAIASLNEAESDHTRTFNNSFSSEADRTGATAGLERARASLAGARADIRVAQTEINRQQERLDDHTIRAPFGGIVTVKNAQPGEIVSPSSAGGGFTRTGICTIVDMDSLEIEVDVNESYIGRVFDGQTVEAQLDAYPDWNIPASVIAIIPTADRAKATVRVRIKLHSKDPRILPDMGVKVAFLESQSNL